MNCPAQFDASGTRGSGAIAEPHSQQQRMRDNGSEEPEMPSSSTKEGVSWLHCLQKCQSRSETRRVQRWGPRELQKRLSLIPDTKRCGWGRTWNLQTFRHVFGMCKQTSSRRTLGIGRLAGRDPSAKPVHCRHGWAGFPAHPVRPCRPTGSERLSEQRLRGHPQGRCFPFDFIDKLFHAAVYGGFIPHMARAFFPYGNARWWG